MIQEGIKPIKLFELPDKENMPYGFWVTKDGIIYSTNNHSRVLKELFNIDSVQEAISRGLIRCVMNANDNQMFYHFDSNKTSPHARKVAEDIANWYGLNYIPNPREEY